MQTILYNNLTALAERIHAGNVAKGFYDHEKRITEAEGSIFESDEQYFTVRNAFINQRLMLITTEVAEACEAVRKDHFCTSEGTDIAEFMKRAEDMTDEEYAIAYKEQVKDRYEAELAGTLIRVLDTAGRDGVDIEKHVQAELRYNRTRPYRHGKNC